MELEQISPLPKHIGIIMDGNGRWAKRKHYPRVFGHRTAMKTVREIVEFCADLKIDVLTLYAFSTENWGRPKAEVEFLMKLFEEFLFSELKTLKQNNVRLRLLGNRERLPGFVHAPLQNAIDDTKDCTGMILCLAVDYGSRLEITQACRQIAEKVKSGDLTVDAINEAVIDDHLFTAGLIPPDLIIRTSGEIRLSNFLLWQSAYAEFYFTETLWPDFNREELLKALKDYSKRIRRIGKVDDQE